MDQRKNTEENTEERDSDKTDQGTEDLIHEGVKAVIKREEQKESRLG
jgi:hypothetical protein